MPPHRAGGGKPHCRGPALRGHFQVYGSPPVHGVRGLRCPVGRKPANARRRVPGASMKKIINDPADVLAESLRGFAAAHADLVAVYDDPAFIVRADAPTAGKV